MTLTDSARGRKLLFAALYLCEGAPIGFLWWALPVRLAEAGVSGPDVAVLLSLLVLPWGLKVLWAPALDVLRSARFGLRGWILTSQLLMGLTLLPLLWLDPLADFGLLTVLLMAHAVFAATQDAAIDTLAISTVPEAERGAVTAWMQVGVLTSRALFGGGALLLGNRFGDRTLVVLLIALVWGGSLVLLLGGASPGPAPPVRRRERLATFLSHLRGMLADRVTWVGFALALLVGAGFEATTSLAGVWLTGRGVGSDAIGWYFTFGSVSAMVTGALLGGRAADRWRRTTAVAVFEGAAALAVIALGLAAVAFPGPEHNGLMLALLAVVYLTVGLATAALYALFMDLTDPALAATQFCAFMAGVNLCESWSTASLGQLLEPLGYGYGFAVMALPSLAALLLLRWIEVGAPRAPAPNLPPPPD